jgi:hypothetical protein
MEDLRFALIAGIDIPIPECKLILKQPRIKDLAFLGDIPFFTGVQTLGLHKSMFMSEDNSVPDDINNFQIFMTVIGEREMVEKRKCVKDVLSLVFPDYSIMFTPRSIVFQDKEHNSFPVDETNFEPLQEVIREVFCLNTGPMDQTAFNPADEKAREIAQKLMRGRQRVAAQKGGANTSVFSQYLSILTVGLHSMSLHDLLDCTMYQLYDLMERYSLYINWDIDVRTRLAGGKPESQPDNWMKNIH